jgi:hypothetical protein
LPAVVSLFQKHLRDVSITGQVLYNIRATGWPDIAAKVEGNQITVPEVFSPSLGELLLHEQKFYEVQHIDVQAPFAVVTVQPFD